MAEAEAAAVVPGAVVDDLGPQRLEDAGVPVPAGLDGDRDGLLDLLLAGVIEPALPARSPLFVFDFPTTQAALARIRADDPPVAERFELFLGGMEMANGMTVTEIAEFETIAASLSSRTIVIAGGGIVGIHQPVGADIEAAGGHQVPRRGGGPWGVMVLHVPLSSERERIT